MRAARLRISPGNTLTEIQNTETEEPTSFLIGADEDGMRLDAYLAERIEGWSRSRLQKLVENEDIIVNDKAVKSSYKLHEGDVVDVDLVELSAVKFAAEDIPLSIVFEDEYLAVINKPSGMVVHPGTGVQSGTLANAIAYHFVIEQSAASGNQAESRVGIVHRLDKDTSGLIVVAKNEETHEALSEQFRERQVYKSYMALVHGQTDENTGKVDAAIGRNKHNRLRMKVSPSGRTALSLWKVRNRYDKFTLLDVEIKTGRTHQIRVHMGYINHPVVGDEIYNEGRDNTIADINVRNAVNTMRRFFLHAEKLSFTHPKTGIRMDFVQELPPELKDFLKKL